MKWISLLVCAFVTLVPTGTSAQSQAIDGTIEGFVRGGEGQPISGVRISALNIQTGLAREAKSDAAGRYTLPLLPPGGYIVTAEAQGLATVTKPDLDLRAGQSITVEIEMGSAAFAETVAVSARTPTVEVGRTVISNTIDERTGASAAAAGPSIQDFYIVQPGVNAGPPDGGLRFGHADHLDRLRRTRPAPDERGRRLEQPAGRGTEPGHQ